MSQPSWAAWIEMSVIFCKSVADILSQPSWAAWIEMVADYNGTTYKDVAALLGCVD